MTPEPDRPDPDRRPEPSPAVDLPIAGMTCASCVGRVERGLAGIDGVDGVPGQPRHRDRDRPLRRARRPGPDAFADQGRRPRVLGARRSSRGHEHDHVHDHRRRGRRCGPRLIVAAVLTVPVLLISMVPALMFDGLAVDRAGALDAGDLLGRLAVPPGDAREPAPRRGHDGHARVARHHGGVALVGRRARVPRRGVVRACRR